MERLGAVPDYAIGSVDLAIAGKAHDLNFDLGVSYALGASASLAIGWLGTETLLMPFRG